MNSRWHWIIQRRFKIAVVCIIDSIWGKDEPSAMNRRDVVLILNLALCQTFLERACQYKRVNVLTGKVNIAEQGIVRALGNFRKGCAVGRVARKGFERWSRNCAVGTGAGSGRACVERSDKAGDRDRVFWGLGRSISACESMVKAIVVAMRIA